jgi:chromosome segregation protein
MRLKHIKLAGFKSFVDPTKVPFEQQMTAIVGPNGCGKSNIIDAVRWVLGESSAKNLRGDSMTDVIFNGAASRKPIGQASVELVFDNTSGRIQGSMADRSQVSIRRVVNRESTNTYYLNGSKCRRRDITDIFLGTGLGPRSYAIIEQGTISRLIESKPQELRSFIEEAAGISKYKERRRDTENRIRHTQENLARLSDIRLELGLQIDKLHQQAEAAKRFKTLKTKERKYKAELAVLRWNKFNEQSNEQQSQLAVLQLDIEKLDLVKQQHENELFLAKQQLKDGGENSGELQQRKIQLTNDIARAEQNIKHLKQQNNKVQQDNAITQQQVINAQKLILVEQENLTNTQKKLEQQGPEFELIEQQLTESQRLLDETILDQNHHQNTFQQAQHKVNDSNKQRLKLNQQKSQLDAQINQQTQRITALNALLSANVQEQKTKQNSDILSDTLCNSIESEIRSTKSEFDSLTQQVKETTSEQLEIQKKIIAGKQQAAEHNGLIAATRKSLQKLKQQQEQRSDWSLKQNQWLENQNISALGPLHSKLTVEQGWQEAVELVVSTWLQAECITNFPQSSMIESYGQSPLFLAIENTEKQGAKCQTVKNSLAEKVSGSALLNEKLNHICVADNYQAALKLLATLEPHQSVICPDGTWLTNHSIQKGQLAPQSLLQAADDIKQLEVSLIQFQQSFNHAIEHENELVLQQQTVDETLNQLKIKKNDSGTLLQKLQQELNLKQQQQQQYEQEKQRFLNEHQALCDEVSSAQQKLQVVQAQLTELPNADANSLIELTDKQSSIQKQMQIWQEKIQQLNQEKHQQAILIEKANNAKIQGQHSLTRAQESIHQLSAQQRANQQILEANVTPLSTDEQNLQKWLVELVSLDKKITELKENESQGQQKINALEQSQKASVERITVKKEQLNALHLNAESFRLRAEAALEQISEQQQNVQQIKQNMPEHAKEGVWQAHLVNLAKDINRLGAINLAAIEEYETQLDRKTYLDRQNDDLTAAISTLELAIAKIDKESRHKFKDTFEQINNDLKALFPKVFGGGSAYLALTGDDLLETGVTIMARPPGKKNSTIHLLSGGEKALTALSLVFAIFRLNPAPFCMLDEVDAPLDDANVSRFCNLVREMSQTVQFIYISHNKIAMEMASQLTGVTMFEPGVSKMVAVDIDEAIAMAEVE